VTPPQTAPITVLDRAAARALCDRVLAASPAAETMVRLEAVVDGHTRFALDQITTAGDVSDVRLTVTAREGSRSASVSFNRGDDAGIAAAVERATSLARLAPEDPEQMPLLGPQQYQPVAAHFDSTAELDAVARADAVARVVAGAGNGDAAGFLQRRIAAIALATSAGLFAYHRSTAAVLSATVRTPDGDGSGWAGITGNDWREEGDPERVGREAGRLAREGVDADPVDPGAYTVVLSATAVGSLVQRFMGALDGRAAAEGRSPFSATDGGTRVGEQIVDDRVTILSDPHDPQLREPPFSPEGLPVSRTVWVEDGVLRTLAADRYWARRQGRDPVPLAGGIHMVGGSGSTDELVATVDRGLLVTRFWYIRGVDPQTMRYTGLTRDGTFLIENGRVARPVQNLRFNQSVLGMLGSIEGIGAARRVIAAESGGLGPAVVVPPLVVRDFRFTSISDAV
jgi:predicted Zn-dependent protease